MRDNRLMSALVKVAKGPGQLELRQVPVPRLGSGDVLIEVKAAGICGTDIHIYHDEHRYWPPVVLGHEFSGEIIEVADDVQSYKVGDRVVAEPHTGACQVCYNCRQGHPEVCKDKRSPGWGIDGGMAEFVKMPARLLHRIPDSLSYQQAALIEPSAVAYQAAFVQGRLHPGEFVVVTGPGVIGLLCGMMAHAGGAREVVVIGTARSAPVRLALAKQLGMSTINIGEQDPPSEIARLSDNIGADVVFEAAGSEAAIKEAISVVRTRGRIVAVGISGKPAVNVPWDQMMTKGCELRFSVSSCYDAWVGAVKLVGAGKINVAPLVSMEFPLADWKEAFGVMERREAIKCLLIPTAR